MKKIIATTLGVLSLLVTTQSVHARNFAKSGATTQQHHSGDGSSLTLGGYQASCSSCEPGSALAETRNINVNGHSQQTVHLKAQSIAGIAEVFLTNLDTITTVVNSPINFSVVKGNAKFLFVVLDYIPHGGTQADDVEINFITPNSALKSENFKQETFVLIDNGHGNYSIPVGTHGIPQGAQLTFFVFDQVGNENNCTVHGSDINHLQINRTFVGISTDPSSSCGSDCSVNGGGNEQ
jgi:hypothetical protein